MVSGNRICHHIFWVVRYQGVKINLGIWIQFPECPQGEGTIPECGEEICFQLGTQCLCISLGGVKGDRENPAEKTDDIPLAALAVFCHASDDSMADSLSFTAFCQQGEIPEGFC